VVPIPLLLKRIAVVDRPFPTPLLLKRIAVVGRPFPALLLCTLSLRMGV